MWNPDRARQVGQEDEARLQRRDEQRLAAVVLGGEVSAQLCDARLQLLRAEIDVADARVECYEARSRWYR